MRTPVRLFVLSVLSLLILTCVACPLRPLARFTNADPGGYGARDDLFDGAPTGAEGEGENTADVIREVTEPDVIRRDGNILYILNQYRGLTLVDLDTRALLAQVPTYGYPRDLYVTGGRAYILVAAAADYKVEDNTVHFSVASRLYVVDVSDPSEAAIVGEPFEFNGDLVDSRLVGDVLYAVCGQYEWYWVEPVGGGGVDDGSVSNGSVGRGTGEVLKTETSSSWVASINVADPNNIYQADEVSFEGLGSVIQATNTAIFVAASDWNVGPEGQTTITYVDIADPAGDIAVRDAIAVRGSLADRYKMDAFEGVLRVVTNSWGWGSDRKIYITTVDLANPDALVTLGATELADATGETLFATRFDGPLGYIVTYFVVDPLFVVDFSDPANPRIGDNPLVVPGWSTHIEPRGDRLLALGVDDTDGMRRVACSMFDVSDPDNPALVGAPVTFGDNWSWSSAYSDVKAFTVLDDVLVVPFSGWTESFGGYERLQFISYTPDGLQGRGYVDVNGAVIRSFEYGAHYYGVTAEQLAVIDGSDLDAPQVVGHVTLAEYVADFIELTPAVGVEIISGYDTGATLVRCTGLADKALGEVTVEVGMLEAAHAYGQKVVLVGTEWNGVDAEFYRVAVVDCADPSAPEVTAELKVDVQPYWGWYWWVDRPGILYATTALDAATKSVIAPWWHPWWPQERSFLLGDRLALRCTSSHYDVEFGGETPTQGLAIIDLAEAAWTSTIGLGYPNLVSMDAVGSLLYLGTKESAGYDMAQPLCAYYLCALDVAEPSVGPTVNVPGVFVQYNPGTDVLVVRDDQWDAAYSMKSSVRSLIWDGGYLLYPVEQLALPANAGTVIGRGGRIYCDAYEEGYRLYAIACDDDGNLDLSPGVLVTDQWATLLDARGDAALVTIGNAIALYDFESGEGVLQGVYETMGYPQSVRYGAANAYVALGYSGVAVLPPVATSRTFMRTGDHGVGP